MQSSMQPPPPQDIAEPGALAQPKMFRRATGAHAILSSLLIVDLVGILLTLLLGALLAPLLWWLAHAGLLLLHSSLLLDSGLLLILAALLIGWASASSSKTGDAWAGPTIFIIVVTVLLLLFKLLQVPWLTIPASIFPAPALQPLNWISPLAADGAAFAAGCSLMAHLVVVSGYRKQAEQQQLSYSRAHLDGDAWWTIHSAYDHFRRGLARFDPPPIPALKTPASFLYYVADAGISDPERKLYWHDSELILPTELISTKQEQAEMLLPYLARLLYDYHTPEIRHVELMLIAVRIARANWFARLMLSLPLRVAVRSEARWAALEKERVLDRDLFAFWCGQGRLLRIQLMKQLQLRNKRHEEDNALPSLTERIDHLRRLLRQDTRQVKHLLGTLPGVSNSPESPALPPPDDLDQAETI